MESATIGRLRNGMKGEGDATFRGATMRISANLGNSTNEPKKAWEQKTPYRKEFPQEDIVLTNGLPTACVSTSAKEKRSTGRTDDDEQTAG